MKLNFEVTLTQLLWWKHSTPGSVVPLTMFLSSSVSLESSWLKGKEVKFGQREALDPKYKEGGGKEEWVFKRVLALPPSHEQEEKRWKWGGNPPKSSCPVSWSLMSGKGQGKGNRWRAQTRKDSSCWWTGLGQGEENFDKYTSYLAETF